MSVEPKHMNLISSKIAKHVDIGYWSCSQHCA